MGVRLPHVWRPQFVFLRKPRLNIKRSSVRIEDDRFSVAFVACVYAIDFTNVLGDNFQSSLAIEKKRQKGYLPN